MSLQNTYQEEIQKKMDKILKRVMHLASKQEREALSLFDILCYYVDQRSGPMGLVNYLSDDQKHSLLFKINKDYFFLKMLDKVRDSLDFARYNRMPFPSIKEGPPGVFSLVQCENPYFKHIIDTIKPYEAYLTRKERREQIIAKWEQRVLSRIAKTENNIKTGVRL